MRRTPPLHQGNEKRSYSFSRAAHAHGTPGEREREREATGKARYEVLCTACTACTATCPGRTAEGRLPITNGHESRTNLRIKPSLVLSRVVRLVLLVCVGHRDSFAPRNKRKQAMASRRHREAPTIQHSRPLCLEPDATSHCTR